MAFRTSPASRQFRWMPWVSAVSGVLLVAVAGILVTAARAEREQREFRMAEQQEQGNQAEQVGRTAGMALARIYEGLRTMSRLPGVQRACISGIALDDNARLTVQELYNALAAAVALSEVYVVPRNMDPDAQPDAGVPVAPLVTFDELILDRGRAEGGGRRVPPPRPGRRSRRSRYSSTA